jgi:hypothetical protein
MEWRLIVGTAEGTPTNRRYQQLEIPTNRGRHGYQQAYGYGNQEGQAGG